MTDTLLCFAPHHIPVICHLTDTIVSPCHGENIIWLTCVLDKETRNCNSGQITYWTQIIHCILHIEWSVMTSAKDPPSHCLLLSLLLFVCLFNHHSTLFPVSLVYCGFIVWGTYTWLLKIKFLICILFELVYLNWKQVKLSHPIDRLLNYGFKRITDSVIECAGF